MKKDNNLDLTNCINCDKELITVYQYFNGKYEPIKVCEDCDVYTDEDSGMIVFK